MPKLVITVDFDDVEDFDDHRYSMLYAVENRLDEIKEEGDEDPGKALKGPVDVSWEVED